MVVKISGGDRMWEVNQLPFADYTALVNYSEKLSSLETWWGGGN